MTKFKGVSLLSLAHAVSGASGSSVLSGSVTFMVGMDGVEDIVEPRKDGPITAKSVMDRKLSCHRLTVTGSGEHRSNSRMDIRYPNPPTPTYPKLPTNQTLVHPKFCSSPIIFTLHHLILFLSLTHFSPTSRRPLRNQSHKVSGYPVCNLQWQFMPHSAGGLGTRSLDNLLCTGE